jgi:hypothetical protein
MPLLRLALPFVRLAFPSLAMGFLAGVAWSRRKGPATHPVPVEPRPEREVIDVPWTRD